jgi:predicted kinase
MAGGTVERDLGPIRVRFDVVRHRLPGGNSTIEAVTGLMVRF